MPVLLPFAYGYGRASHEDNMDSIPDQIERITQYYRDHLATVCQWGGVHWDTQPVSASKTAFPKRKIGKHLIELMRPGDHIIFDKIDRIWRSIQDFVNLMQYFKNQRITVHFKDMRGCTVAMNTPMGDFMLTLMVAIAELESHTTSHRIKERQAAMRNNGEYASGGSTVPYGCKIEIIMKKRRLVWNEQHRKTMAEIVRLVDVEKKSFSEVDQILGPFTAKNHKRTAVQRLYKRERFYQVCSIQDPSDMPPGKSLRELESLFGGIRHKLSLEERLKYAEGAGQ